MLTRKLNDLFKIAKQEFCFHLISPVIYIYIYIYVYIYICVCVCVCVCMYIYVIPLWVSWKYEVYSKALKFHLLIFYLKVFPF